MDYRSEDTPKHTPGPWGVLPYTSAGEFGDYAIVCDTRERDIAAVEEEADAQLIGAAPEMLEALKRAEPALWMVATSGSKEGIFIHQICKYAIAKAEGRQQ